MAAVTAAARSAAASSSMLSAALVMTESKRARRPSSAGTSGITVVCDPEPELSIAGEGDALLASLLAG